LGGDKNSFQGDHCLGCIQAFSGNSQHYLKDVF